MDKTPQERRFDTPFGRPIVPFWCRTCPIILFGHFDTGKLHLFGSNVFADYSWVMSPTWEEIGLEICSLWTREDLQIDPAPEFHVARIHAQKAKVRTFHSQYMFPFARRFNTAERASSSSSTQRYLECGSGLVRLSEQEKDSGEEDPSEAGRGRTGSKERFREHYWE